MIKKGSRETVFEYRKVPIENLLSPLEIETYELITEAYSQRMLGPRRYSIVHVKQTLYVLQDAVKFTKKAPWHWSCAEINEWIKNYKVAEFCMASQRAYVGIINRFMRYIAESYGINYEIRERFGVQVKYEA